MHRFLPGLVLVQVVALALYAVNAGAPWRTLALNLGIPVAIVTLVTAFWFASLSRQLADRRQADERERHARERESLQLDAARDRERLVGAAAREREQALEQVRREAQRERRRGDRAASLKVGGAYLAVTLLGVLFLFTELMTLGLLTITTSGGALGGYLLRWRQTRRREGPSLQPIDDHATPPRLVQDTRERDAEVAG